MRELIRHHSFTDELTPARRLVLDTLLELERELGYPPTLREVAVRLGRSTTSVYAAAARLERDGWLVRAGGRNSPRSLRPGPRLQSVRSSATAHELKDAGSDAGAAAA